MGVVGDEVVSMVSGAEADVEEDMVMASVGMGTTRVPIDSFGWVSLFAITVSLIRGKAKTAFICGCHRDRVSTIGHNRSNVAKHSTRQNCGP